MRKKLTAFLLFLLPTLSFGQAATPKRGKPVVIPTRYSEHRFTALPVTKDGVTLTLFTDSAGAVFFYEDVVARLGLTPVTIPGAIENGRQVRAVVLPDFKPALGVPPPLGSREHYVFVLDRPKSGPTAALAARDGMLGQQWFAGRVWTFDYPGHRLLWRSDDDIPRHSKKHEVTLGFKTNEAGKRETNFARIPIEIDGETIDFLFDTGATNILSDDVLKLIADGRPADRATSFMTRGLFEKLRTRHPDWRYFDKVKTLTGAAMLEVPKITIGGYTVGPVWFTIQPDFAFHNYMASVMDKPTEGAIGGSALHYLRVTVDWPRGIAVFERP